MIVCTTWKNNEGRDIHFKLRNLFLLWITLKRLKLRNENTLIGCGDHEAFNSKSISGSISESQSASRFLKEIEQFFAKNEKTKMSNLLTKLIRGNIREYIIEVSNLATKLRSLKLELDEDLIMHLVLIYLPAYFGQFKVSYNTQKDKWSLNELISHCVQEEERLQRNKKRKNIKGVTEESSKGKETKKNEEFTCFFYKKSGHMKK
ncbi:hypothetical protein CR513_40906, partial [Mucuna pruriens]